MPTRPIRVYLTGCRECALSMVPGFGVGTCPPPRKLLEGLGNRRWGLTMIPLEDAEIKQNLVATGEPATNQGQLKREMGMVPPA
jgi:hypothetical protein